VVSAIVAADGKECAALSEGAEAAVILNQTPFYGESGGQVGDRGTIRTADGTIFQVSDTQKRLGDLVVHYGRLAKGVLHRGDAVELAVDHARRQGVRRHHSATHLVHEALRQVLGGHVTQKGSLVEPGRLRFDFSHQKALDDGEIARVEEIANAVILHNDPVTTRLLSVDDAIAEGAMALFGEKYGEEVRVVSMGRQPEGGPNKPVYSLELCGGTHVARTGDIGLVRIVAETASAAGVRRIEALAGAAARHYLDDQDNRVQRIAALLKVQPGKVETRISQLLDERRRLERELGEAKKHLAMGGDSGGNTGPDEIAGIKVLARVIEGIDPRELRNLVDEARKKLGSGIVALVAVNEGKATVAAGVSQDLTATVSAIDLVRAGVAAVGGKGGGGRPDMAQGGGPDGARAGEAIAAIKAAIGA
jgi:alanyl-tRNA synthetase